MHQNYPLSQREIYLYNAFVNNPFFVAGIEKLGLEEFQKGGFWDRELYIDNGKKILKALDIKSVGILNSLKMLYDIRDSLKKANKHAGNLKGDGR